MEADVHLRPKVAGKQPAPFEFKQTIYGHKAVKESLRIAQHDKCAYCEASISANSSGDVEHFRPKVFSQQGETTERLYPGYYWLAYTWSNLLYACELCNRPVKRNLFPLKTPVTRARRPADNLLLEEPLLVDPAGPGDPRDHIRFRHNKPYGITSEGKETVRTMNLDRAHLDDARLKHICLVESLRKVARLDPVNAEVQACVDDAKAELARLVGPKAPFSAMTQDLLAT
jgi:uncharacterized protein (TIGR02646 family)